jgi:hypothetical protein
MDVMALVGKRVLEPLLAQPNKCQYQRRHALVWIRHGCSMIQVERIED